MPVLSLQKGVLEKWAKPEAPEGFHNILYAPLKRQGCWCWAQEKWSIKVLTSVVQLYKSIQ